jgi:pyrophosphate--fructose-6-phosphate 1-phosphotransferase
VGDVSPLDGARREYRPQLPAALRDGLERVGIEERETAPVPDAIRERFPRTAGRAAVDLGAGAGPTERRPLRAGVVLSGGPAPGGHNVVAGLVDALAGLDRRSAVIGFLGGPRGILESRHRELPRDVVEAYRNTGGFDLLGSGRDKIETPGQLDACAATCVALALDGLVVVGGDDSNTNAAILAEHFAVRGIGTTVVGVPKTIDGDMRGGGIEASFGFDTATKVYAELVGNIARDARSSGKYWHFIRLMGRSASHVTLECALRTRPNVALIGEEIAERGATLDGIVDGIAQIVRRRADAGRSHGVCLVPEGLIEFVPEIRALIAELNAALGGDAAEAAATPPARVDRVRRRLGAAAAATLDALPEPIREQLVLDRDDHGNVRVSQIDTEALLVGAVEARIRGWAAAGAFRGSFRVVRHSFGYEGRCAAPSNFDADYTYTLGHVAAALVAFGRTGYVAAVQGLAAAPDRWRAGAVPLTSLLRIETRKGRPVPVIEKALVRTDGPAFRAFAAERERWAEDDAYVYPGPIQYFGPGDVAGAPPLTLALEHPTTGGSSRP